MQVMFKGAVIQGLAFNELRSNLRDIVRGQFELMLHPIFFQIMSHELFPNWKLLIKFLYIPVGHNFTGDGAADCVDCLPVPKVGHPR